MKPLFEFFDAKKTFKSPSEELNILNNINLTIQEGESISIVGCSGSGKSTLLHLMGGLDILSSGTLLFAGKDLARMSSDEKALFRNRSVGFVFQFHHLLPEFSVLENVAMQALIAKNSRKQAFAKAEQMLERVGLGDKLEHKVNILSGGERQRVAIARAVLQEPRVLLADEPTGNLDENTGIVVGNLLAKLNGELGMTLVVVTHNRDLAKRMDRNLELSSGVLYEQALN